jgi:uroporphyrinogen decarboxylase
MTPKERILAVCQGRLPDRVPLVLMSREFSLKYTGIRFADVYENPDLYIQAQVKVLQDFELDCVFDLVGVPAVDEFLGAQLVLPDDDPPWIGEPCVKTRKDLEKFGRVDPETDGRMPYLLDLIANLRRQVGPDIPVLAWASLPFRTACMLRGNGELYKDFYRDPEFVKDIIEASYEPCLAYGKALVDAGADMIYITNPTASADCISREHYEEFAHASSRKMHRALKEHGAEVVFFHPCGRWEDRLDLLFDLEVDVLHFDNLDVASFKSEYDGKSVYMGNVHSIDTLLSGTTTDVENETLDCLRDGAPGGGYILGANCAVPKDTDPAHVRAMAEGIRHHGQYGPDG